MISPLANLYGQYEIGKDTKVGAFCDIGNCKIGKYCMIETMVSIPKGVTIGDRVFIGPQTVFTNDRYPPSDKIWPITVEDDVVIGANCTILAGITIGKGAKIPAHTFVVKDVPAGDCPSENWKKNAKQLPLRDCRCRFNNPVCGVCILPRDGDKVLLSKRAEEPFKGQWDTLGGYMNGIETPEECAHREWKEETGLEADMRLEGFFPSHSVYDGEIFTVMNFVFSCKVNGTPKPSDDVSEVKWFDKNNIPEIPMEGPREAVRRYVCGGKITSMKYQKN